jgi:hypothetical protein
LAASLSHSVGTFGPFPVHQLARFNVRKDRQRRKRLCVLVIPAVVIGVPVSVQQLTDRLVGPSTNLGDIFAGFTGHLARIHYEDFPADNHSETEIDGKIFPARGALRP